jgi:hypothetical protein
VRAFHLKAGGDVETTPSCFDCKTEAPKTDTDYTLISSGWRLARRQTLDGAFSFEWRCPACWATYKAVRGLSSSGSMPRVAASPYNPAEHPAPARNPIQPLHPIPRDLPNEVLRTTRRSRRSRRVEGVALIARDGGRGASRPISYPPQAQA